MLVQANEVLLKFAKIATSVATNEAARSQASKDEGSMMVSPLLLADWRIQAWNQVYPGELVS